MMATLPLPTHRDEAWRWSDLPALQAAAGLPRISVAPPESLNLGGARLVFVDSVFDATQSDAGRLIVAPLALSTDHPLGARASGTGWSLTLDAAQAETPVEIIHVSTGAENHLPARIVLGENAVASVVETFVGTGWANRLTQIELGTSARLSRAVRVLHDGGFVSTRDEVTVGQGAAYVATVLVAGDVGARIDAQIDITGEQAFAEMGGALLTRDALKQECAVAVRHAAAHGSSNQTWRAVAADKSAASLAARVEVARDAQKTDGVQSLRGLLLERTATINLKPELEIFADDVKCAHGATVGELDAKAMFYLASRGIGPIKARAMLTRAFVGDALDRIGNETIRDAFAADADAWLEAAL